MQTTPNPIEQFAHRATQWIGSSTSLVIHTIFFISAFGLKLFGVSFDQILLGMTTIVSFEAIYLSIFIQMTVNQQAAALYEVKEDIGEIQEDIEEIQEDVEDMQEEDEDGTDGKAAPDAAAKIAEKTDKN